MVPRRSMRHSWLGSMGSETALSEQVAALSERSGGCGPEEEPSTRYPGRDQLRESDLTFQVLVESLNRYIWESGQLSHWRKWWPVYGLAFLGVLVGAWRWRLGEREVRHGLVQHSAEVWRQFLNEWILLPFQQLWEALLLPGPKEELRVQLRDLRAEEEALERMVTSFARFARAESTFAVKGKEGVEDAALPELYFEWSMTNPISNVVTGHLAESCMVQSQKLKVLLYASLYSIDAVMMQLKWDFLMAGVMPTTLLCGCVSWIISSSRRRRQLESRRKMVRALAELDRFLNRNMAFLSPRRVNELPQMEGAVGTVPLKSLLSQALGLDEDPELPSNGLASGLDSSIDLDKVGAALCHLDTLCRMASRIRLEDADWRAFRRDILDLTSPELSVAEKLHVIATMRHTYHVFDLGLSLDSPATKAAGAGHGEEIMESPELLERMLTMTHMDIQLYAVALHSFEQDGVQMCHAPRLASPSQRPQHARARGPRHARAYVSCFLVLVAPFSQYLASEHPVTEAEWRAQRLVYNEAQAEGAQASLDRFITWLTGNGGPHVVRLPLVEQWHALSKTVINHGFTGREISMICVGAFCVFILGIVLWRRR
ncbi:Nuclear control of ATPase protein 2 [Durusdinium trenchii]|uniref:Nuclear control of ATPase protein 2 n=1 Tax=Durusdinium trenchii TaxID=1381693 RepID=A0ABP0R176_9DINO